jgi:hypothetical protein
VVRCAGGSLLSNTQQHKRTRKLASQSAGAVLPVVLPNEVHTEVGASLILISAVSVSLFIGVLSNQLPPPPRPSLRKVSLLFEYLLRLGLDIRSLINEVGLDFSPEMPTR